MKKLLFAIWLASTMGVSAVAISFPATVDAAAGGPAEIAEVAQESHPDIAQNRDNAGVNSQFSPEAVQQRIQTYHNWQNQSGGNPQNPVDAARSAASSLGLNGYTDTFSLVGKTASVATVHVIHQKKGYTVTLVPSGNGAWIVASISPA